MTFIKKITNGVGVAKKFQSRLDHFDHDEDTKNPSLLCKVGTVDNGQLIFEKNVKSSKYPSFIWTIHCSS